MSLLPNRLIGLALVTASVLLSSAGQLWMRAGMLELRHSALAADLNWIAVKASQAPLIFILGGLFAYAVSLLAWLVVLQRYPLSYAYPLLSLSYVLVYIGATQWGRLLETATPLRSAGTILILAGVLLVSRSANETDR